MTLRLKIQHDEPKGVFGVDVEVSDHGTPYKVHATLYPGDEPATVYIHSGRVFRLTEFRVSERPKPAA